MLLVSYQPERNDVIILLQPSTCTTQLIEVCLQNRWRTHNNIRTMQWVTAKGGRMLINLLTGLFGVRLESIQSSYRGSLTGLPSDSKWTTQFEKQVMF